MSITVRTPRGTVEINPTFLDRAISYVSPVTGARRLHARLLLAMTGGYNGGSRSRIINKKWLPRGASAASDILPDLPTLRARSRDLVRNAPLATGAVAGVVTSVVGPGMIPQARIDRDVLTMTDAQADEWQNKTEREWRLFAKHCDLERSLPFTRLQELAFRSALESGDSFLLFTSAARPESPYRTKLQLIEADRVCNPNRMPDSATLQDGVELSDVGAPLAYHVSSVHPGDSHSMSKGTWARIPAFTSSGRRAMLHMFRKLRPGQSRGVPYLAPVIETLKQLDRYTEAEITAAVVSGMFSVFVRTPAGEEGINPLGPPSSASGPSTTVDGDEITLGPGMIAQLGDGQDISTVNPGRPNTAFDPFVKAILQQIAVALELPYEVMLKHFTSSYSASRAALLEAWRFFSDRRQWLAMSLCDPVWEAFMDEAVASGRVAAPGYFSDPIIRQAYLGVHWIGPAKGMIDEMKEINAAKERIALGVTTHAEETSQLVGGDWDSKVARLQAENIKKAKAFPTPPSPAPGVAAQEKGSGAPPPDEEEDEGDEELTDEEKQKKEDNR